MTLFMFEQDYLMRMINDFIRNLARILLNKDKVTYELPAEESYIKTDYLHIQLIGLIEQGKINEAENLLYQQLVSKDKKYIELALDFYERLSNLDDDFLVKNNFAREEIEEGLKDLAKKCGISL